MISILVPIFNVDVTTLVKELHNQASLLDIPFEIICVDDHSTDSLSQIKNAEINLDKYTYEVLKKNIGRCKIRQYLAEKASFEQLLFLDCDVRINHASFLKTYQKHLAKSVVVGGIEYSEYPPENKGKYLRWVYGRKREQKSALERQKMRFSHFVASNLLIKKQLFLSISGDDNISGYGHEDTLLGIKLLEKKITIDHIDNPVEHLGLDNAEIFLEKSESGVKNLSRLYKNNQVGRQLKIIDLFVILEQLQMKNITRKVLEFAMPALERNLKSSNPKLIYFDLWKLYHFLLFSK